MFCIFPGKVSKGAKSNGITEVRTNYYIILKSKDREVSIPARPWHLLKISSRTVAL